MATWRGGNSASLAIGAARPVTPNPCDRSHASGGTARGIAGHAVHEGWNNASPGRFGSQARLNIAPQPKRAELAPRRALPRAGLFCQRRPPLQPIRRRYSPRERDSSRPPRAPGLAVLHRVAGIRALSATLEDVRSSDLSDEERKRAARTGSRRATNADLPGTRFSAGLLSTPARTRPAHRRSRRAPALPSRR